MANLSAIYSVGDSLVSHLRNGYELSRVEAGLPNCRFALLSSGSLTSEANTDAPVEKPGVTLYLYRVNVNEHMRNQPRGDAPPPLSLDLHYLLTVWADDVKDEHRILTWTMHRLHTHQTLSASDLTSEGGWAPGELVQIIPSELSHEDLTRLWESLRRPYRLSASYVARVVRIDVAGGPTGKPVVSRRFTYNDRETEP